MATEAQARRARDLHEKELVASGAHALSVEPVLTETEKATKSFCIVAWVQKRKTKKQVSLPESLEIEDQGRKVKVPLKIRESKPFQLE